MYSHINRMNMGFYIVSLSMFVDLSLYPWHIFLPCIWHGFCSALFYYLIFLSFHSTQHDTARPTPTNSLFILYIYIVHNMYNIATFWNFNFNLFSYCLISCITNFILRSQHFTTHKRVVVICVCNSFLTRA